MSSEPAESLDRNSDAPATDGPDADHRRRQQVPLVRLVGSPLARKVALVVFAAIVIAEAAILLPSYARREGELIRDLRNVGAQWVLAAGRVFEESGNADSYAAAILRGPLVAGVAVYDASGRRIAAAGEAIDGAGFETGPGAGAWDFRAADGGRYEALWPAGEAGTPVATVLRLDSTHIADALTAYVLRMAGLIVLISAVLTAATMVAMGAVVVRPLVNLREALAGGGDWSDRGAANLERNDEIGEVFRATVALLDGNVEERQAPENQAPENQTREELARQNEILEAALENIDQAVIMYDKDLRVQVYNHRYCELRGMPEEYMATRPTLREMFRLQLKNGYYPEAEKDPEAYMEDWIVRTMTGPEATRVFEHVLPDGSVHEARGRRLANGGFVRTFADITVRKKAEAALRESEQRFRAIVDHLPIGINLRDIEGRYMLVNKQLADWWGVTDDEIRGKFPSDELGETGGELEARTAHHREVVETLSVITQERKKTRADGNRSYVQIKKFPLFDSDGALIAVGTAAMDITKYKKAEQAIAEKEAMLRATVENMPGGIYMVDSNLNIVVHNERIKEMFGYPDGVMAVGQPVERAVRFRARKSQYGEQSRKLDIEALVKERLDVIAGKIPDTIPHYRVNGRIFQQVRAPIAGGGMVTIVLDRTEQTKAEEALRESENRIRAIIDATPAAVYLTDLEGRYLIANRAMAERQGFTPEKILGKTAYDHYPKKVADAITDHYQEVIRTRQTVTREMEIPRRVGESYTGLVVKFPVVDSEGRIAAVGTITTNISTRRRMEEELRANEAQLRLSLDNMTDGIYVVDRDMRYLMFNDRYLELIDWPKGSIKIADPVRDVILKMAEAGYYGPGDPVKHTDGRMRGLRSKDTVQNEVTLPSGRVVDVRKSPLQDGGAVVTLTDITERKRLAEDLAAEASKMRMVLDHMPGGIFWIDKDLNYQLVNDQYWKFHGFPKDGVQPGMSLVPMVRLRAERGDYGPGDVDKLVQARIKTYDSLESTEDEVPGGRTVETVRRRAEDGGVVAVFTDVTERKKAETALHAAKEETDAANQAKSELVAVVSHEVRTPMNGVLGMARLLREMVVDSEQRECVEIIVASGESLLRIVDDLLDVSKLEAGRLELETMPFIASDVVSESIATMAPRAEEKGLKLAYEVDSKIPSVLIGDAHRIRQVLLNLVSNAIKFTQQGSVTVKARLKSTDRNTAVVGFSVADTGQGIKPETRERLFSPYAQGAVEVARKYGGTGLGLNICWRLVALMKSEIKLRSSVGKGSTFRFDVSLPIDRATDPATLRETATPASVDPKAAAGRPLRILQVEDNKNNRNVAERILSRAGHEVVSVVDGAEALKAIDGGEFDIVIMDRHMPVMNGIEATKRIRKMAGPVAAIPILGVTAGAIQSELDACLQAGMDEVLTKPVNGPELLATVARMAAPAGADPRLGSDRPVLVVDDMKINLTVARRQLEKLGVPCVATDSAPEALKRLKKETFAAVLLDISMPTMDGLEFTRRVREWERTRDRRVPIIAMTGFVAAADRKRFLKAGMDDFLAKPVVLEALARTLGRWLAAPDGAVADPPARTPRGDGGADAPIDMAPIDMTLLGEILGDDDEAGKLDWVGDFIEAFPPLLEILAAAVVEKDPKATRDAAHAAKSAASSAGAAPLMALLKQLEADAPSAEWDGIDAAVATVTSEFARVVEFRDTHQGRE